MQARILELAPVNIACLRYVGPMGLEVGQFWQRTVQPWLQENGLENVARYGIGHDDPDLTPPDRCRYDACAEVPANFLAASNVHLTTLPGGWYAAIDFRGKAEEMGAAWTALFSQWLPGSGFSLDAARPCFEHYAPNAFHDRKSGEFACDLCLPVLPK